MISHGEISFCLAGLKVALESCFFLGKDDTSISWVSFWGPSTSTLQFEWEHDSRPLYTVKVACPTRRDSAAVNKRVSLLFTGRGAIL